MRNKKPWNVLVFPGGTENGLEINKSLRYAKEVMLYSASSSVKNHAEYMFENHFVVSDIFNDNCLAEINNIIEQNEIDYIFPANSLIIDFLVEHRSDLKCEVILPDSDIVRTVRSKKSTYELFKNRIPVPQVFQNIEEIDIYPVFIKPDSLYGSQGTRKVNSSSEMEYMQPNLKEYVISEYLCGDEFTVECFSSKEKGVMYSMARSRERIRMGTSMRSELAPEKIQMETKEIANTIFELLIIDGLWFFQMKYDKNGVLKLLEIETRVAGTMAYSRCMGVNLPLANLYLKAGKQIKINPQKYEMVIDRSLANRYTTNIEYDVVYIDLDDTIIVKGKLNLEIIKFLYQCVNKGKRIVLISKSLVKDKNGLLNKLKIIQLFDEIVWLEENENKADMISEKKSIFIDDSFSQRKEVEDKHSIPTFEPNMIEVLMDDRSV
ncbi:ATP-grasp domain-containing protein [Bacteroidota bacterium]